MSTPELASLLAAQRPRFLAFLARRTRSEAEAEDLLQQAFVRAIEKGGELRAEESSVAWFYRLLRNAVTDAGRRRDAEGRALERHARELEESEEPELRDVACACVGELIGQLPDAQAEILRAVDLEGRAVKAFAGEAGITPNNAAVRLHRARQRLRAVVTDCCGSCAEDGCQDCTCGAASVAG